MVFHNIIWDSVAGEEAILKGLFGFCLFFGAGGSLF